MQSLEGRSIWTSEKKMVGLVSLLYDREDVKIRSLLPKTCNINNTNRDSSGSYHPPQDPINSRQAVFHHHSQISTNFQRPPSSGYTSLRIMIPRGLP